MYEFANKIVLLTGATGGLGRALTRKLADEGARLILTGRTSEALEELIAGLPDASRATAIDEELHRPGGAERLARAAEARHGRVDVLINNAGMGYFALVEEAIDDRVRELFELNTFAPLVLIRKLLPGMKARGEGRIVNIASAAGRVPIPTVGIYGGSKSALALIANTLRLELEPAGIEVINVYPGTIRTSFEVNALRESGRGGLDPHARSGRPVEEIAARVVSAARGPSREVWLERPGFWLAAASLLLPRYVARRLRPLRDRAVAFAERGKSPEERRWRLWQIETSMDCQLRCEMCPWRGLREESSERPLMSDELWECLRPHLGEVAAVDFTGGGEPLLHPALPARIADAKSAGCEVGFLSNAHPLDEERSRALLSAGVDWVAFSIDGANAEVYESIRIGASFARVIENIRRLAAMRADRQPRIALNFVIMERNVHQLEAIVHLAAELGVEQVNFKQCDVSRGEFGRGLGVFRAERDRETRRREKALASARKRARRLRIETTAFSFVPEEEPVCGQDPRSSLFIRWDGRVAPCINKAYGGPTHFFDREVEIPEVCYGSVAEDSPLALWEGDACREHRDVFQSRVEAHDGRLQYLGPGLTMQKLDRAYAEAREAMPPPPAGCEVCHYLHGT